MDFLFMMKHPVVQQWLAQSMVIFFVLAGAALLVFGVSLIVNSAGALRLIAVLNRWVSMRPATKPLEIPRDTRPLVQKYRYGFAAVFILGGAFALYGLLFQFEFFAAVRLLGMGAMAPDASHWIVDSLRWLLLIGNALAVVAGILLAFFPALVETIEARAGRWVSMRPATKPLEIPRDTRPLVQKYRYGFAAVFILGGAFALYGLLFQFEFFAAVHLLGLGAMAPDASHWIVDSLRWLLVIGNALAVVAGILLAFFPARVDAIEARAGRWVSVRKATKGADDMRVRLDPLVEVYPRAVGVTVIVIGLALIGTFGLMAQRVW